MQQPNGSGLWNGPGLPDSIDPNRSVLLIRHGQREPIYDIRQSERAALTVSGRKSAHLLGQRLRRLQPTRIFCSPVRRCLHTGEAMQRGIGHRTRAKLIPDCDFLAMPYLLDLTACLELASRIGAGPFLRVWFDGRLSPNMVMPPAKAARLLLRQLDICRRWWKKGLHIHVTHDWNLILLRNFALGGDIDPDRWPDFLNGLWLDFSGTKITVSETKSTARVSGEALVNWVKTYRDPPPRRNSMSEETLKSIAEEHWPEVVQRYTTMEPLRMARRNVLTHASMLYLVSNPGGSYVLKHTTAEAAVRPAGFHAIKHKILTFCAERNVPVLIPVLTRDRLPIVTWEGTTVELLPCSPGKVEFDLTATHRRNILDGFLRLRSALEATDQKWRDALHAYPSSIPVEVENVGEAVRQAMDELLPLSRTYCGPLADNIRHALEGVVGARGLLRDSADQPAVRHRLIHADYQTQNLLFDSESRLSAILDFDNLRNGNAAFEWSWLFDQLATGLDPAERLMDRTFLESVEAALETGGLTHEELLSTMPILLRYVVPIVVDIAKDILLRNDHRPEWARYLELCDCERKLSVHQTLIKILSARNRIEAHGY